jgi:hypothetical protein
MFDVKVRFGRGRKALVVVTVVSAIGLLVGGASFAVAGGGDHARSSSLATTAAAVGQASGGGCRMGYDTETSIVTPPDDSTSDNPPAATVSIRKPCPGAVIGEFTSETSIPSGGYIHLDMRATCTSTGGFTSPCTVGQQVFASPGHTFFASNAGAIETHAMNMVWSGLPRGVWTFEVLPGGNGTAFVDFRTYVVEAFSGG